MSMNNYITYENAETLKEGGMSSVSVGGLIAMLESNSLDWLSHPLTYMVLSSLVPFAIRSANAHMKYYFDKKRKASNLDTTEGTESKDPNKQ